MFVTPDFKNNPVGIGEGVMMRALDRDALRSPGDGLVALTTDNVLLFFGRSLCGFLAGRFRSNPFTVLWLRALMHEFARVSRTIIHGAIHGAVQLKNSSPFQLFTSKTVGC
jgi:hypothetical protein